MKKKEDYLPAEYHPVPDVDAADENVVEGEYRELPPIVSPEPPETQEITSEDSGVLEDGEEPEGRPSFAERAGRAVRASGRAGEGALSYIGERITETPPEDDLGDLTTVRRDDITGDAYGEDNSDLFDVSDEDVMGDDGDESMDDILGVDDEDIMGVSLRPKVTKTRRTRPKRNYPPSFGGMNY